MAVGTKDRLPYWIWLQIKIETGARYTMEDENKRLMKEKENILWKQKKLKKILNEFSFMKISKFISACF